ncbi:MAG: amino acid adenylation domain-containing protein [Candidatus Electrothrix sp. AUS4]|nr:amino acid adenylation domain-containing protein [Candidatus Electrothrix sp. AUS4]
MTRSAEMIIALYGIIKAGAAYVPLEPEFPDQRLAFILAETEANVVLTQDDLRHRLAAGKKTTLCLDTEWHKLGTFPQTNPSSNVTTDNLAYIIYTSGSTGTPKGVMIEHKAIYNRLQWMQDFFQLQSDDRVLQKTPYSFDVSVWEFFWPLFTGATLVVAPVNVHKDPIKLCEEIITQGITTIHFVPSMLRLFLDTGKADRCTSLRRVICSGEALSLELQRSFFQQATCDLYNLYGPTEAAVDVSYWQCINKGNNQKVPIGFPIANTQLYILDEHLKPVPQGAVGELYIGGVQVARGYLNRLELNAQTFLPDPFSQNINAKLYKTGDLARYLPDGAIDYLGRADFQIKLHGNRIELDEIVVALCKHPRIKEAVVTLHTASQGKQRLIAYLLSDETDETQLQLRRHLSPLLPLYMIPSQFILLSEFPLTDNGKINRKILPDPESFKKAALSVKISDPDKLSSVLTAKWRKILDRTEISMHDNFFDVGGNSLLAAQLSLDLKYDLRMDVPLIKFFQYPTIAKLTDYLKGEFSTPEKQKNIHRRAQFHRQALMKRKKR